MDNTLQQIISQNKRMDLKDIYYLVYKAHRNREDYLMLNYIEKSIISSYGQDFMNISMDKISLVIQLLLDDTPDKIFEMYEGALDVYLEHAGESNKTSFNLIFFTYIHLGMKTILANTKKEVI